LWSVPRSEAWGSCYIMPHIFRVVSIERFPHSGNGYQNRAMLFHEQAKLAVEWTSDKVDFRLVPGSLASLDMEGEVPATTDAVPITQLQLLELPVPTLNLFETIPPGWVRNRELVQRGLVLWASLPNYCQHLFNAMFWASKRFQRFAIGPSSMNGHHAERNGNLRHSVEVAEYADEMSHGNPDVCRPVLILAALIHDAGKADEYEYDDQRKSYFLSRRGILIGHRHTVIEWLAAAEACYQIDPPPLHYLTLLHSLTSARGTTWLGIREPRSLEATLLSISDRLSGEADLVHRQAPASDGFGKHHPHLRGRSFVVRHQETGHILA
ncbi:HD domain-containing protein, partial [Propionivibrio sp.]|uniref:HD domain-containing protein n=1 Tax=Propionivibrio sp. TaxID=2212460 RepID=UPI003BF0361B